MAERAILIVLDSVGIGELPDAADYGDVGSDTLDNIAKSLGGINLPNMESLGLGCIEGVTNIRKAENPKGAYGRCMEKSMGKDTVTGHWEISGIVLENPMPTYPDGFPERIISDFESRIGRKIIGNKAASGTEIIAELGEEHVRTGYPIVYTSADSVFQIAAHEEIIPLEDLYEMCEKAREMLTGKDGVGRVIARPFTGAPGNFTRTPNRKDFALTPEPGNMMDIIKKSGCEVKAVGKIDNIFCGQGVTESVHTVDNMDGVDKTIEYMKGDYKGLIFTNLVDFDMKFGHRNDVSGYGKALEEFDGRLPEIFSNMREDDILIITADHGCDPTTESTDHSREYIPVMVYGAKIKDAVNLGTRNTFCDIGSTVLEYLGLNNAKNGRSFLRDMIR